MVRMVPAKVAPKPTPAMIGAGEQDRHQMLLDAEERHRDARREKERADPERAPARTSP